MESVNYNKNNYANNSNPAGAATLAALATKESADSTTKSTHRRGDEFSDKNVKHERPAFLHMAFFLALCTTLMGISQIAKAETGDTLITDQVANNGQVYDSVDTLHFVSGTTSNIVDSDSVETSKIASTRLSLNQDVFEFGSLSHGQTFSRTLLLSNRGGAGSEPLFITNLFLDELDEQSFHTDFIGPATLYPGDQLKVEISFSPVKPGVTTGALFLTHSHGTLPILLSGFGLAGFYPDYKEVEKFADEIPRAAPSFGKSLLSGVGNIIPTSLQFGPDGRLYVATLSGQIKIFTIERSNANKYKVTATETLNHIQSIKNYNDNGSPNNNLKTRLVTGLLVTGTSTTPVVFVNSGDPRIGGGASGDTTNLDTNSTVISRLTKNGNGWNKLDLVRGLPRSEENHAANGLAISSDGKKLYLAMGGNTNQGAPSNNFAKLPEYAYSAAILEINLAQIGNSTYDMPTLNDEDRSGSNDWNDPFGGNRGKNQAKIVSGGPVQVYAPGFRNAYDVVLATNGKLYSFDNGSNAGWGGVPKNNSTQGICTNAVMEPGDTRYDSLHVISGPGYYGGHPNPTRGNKNNKFNKSIPQSPVSNSNKVECHFRGGQGPSRSKHAQNKSLTYVPASTNGLVEYTASNFNGAMQGDLLAAAFNNKVYRVQLNGSGTTVTSNKPLFSNVGKKPLDVTAQGDNSVFPGSIWVADFIKKSIIVFEPADFQGNQGGSCSAHVPSADSDQDGYSNADETANETNPCSAADLPADADGDFISDLIDPDDDNDGIKDINDPFALDKFNGATTPLGTIYDWENSSAAAPFIANLGFSGLMTNGSTNYQNQFDLNEMTVAGAAGVVTVDTVPGGDAVNGLNSQEYAFQFGVDVNQNSPIFQAKTRILAPFSGAQAKLYQSIGLYIGNGDQDNYIKLVANPKAPQGALQFLKEANGKIAFEQQRSENILNAEAIDLIIEVNPATLQVKPFYQLISDNETGPLETFGDPTSLPASWFGGNTKLAIGIISTSFRASPFSATWDFIEVTPVYNGTDNQAPLINAGYDQSVMLPNNSTLSATVTDDGLPTNTLSYNWSLLSGPGTVEFSNATALTTTASFSKTGTYLLKFSASDGELSQSDDIIVYAAGIDASSGNDVNNQTNTPANYVTLEAEDYDSKVAAGSHAWVEANLSGHSGSGAMITTPNIGNIKHNANGSPKLSYTVNFPAKGSYYVWVRGWGDTNAAGEGKNDSLHVGLNNQLQTTADKVDQFPAGGWAWTNSTRDPVPAKLIVPEAGVHTVNIWMREDGLAIDRLEFTTDVTYEPTGTGISVDSSDTDSSNSNNNNNNNNDNDNDNDNDNTPKNMPPTSNAGNNFTATTDIGVSLDGVVNDDGLPNNALSSLWSKQSGPGDVSFSDASSPGSLVTFPAAGNYVLKLTASDGQLSDIDTVSVTVDTPAVNVDVDDTTNSDNSSSDDSENSSTGPANFVAVEIENYDSKTNAGQHAWVAASKNKFPGFSGAGAMVTTPNIGTLKGTNKGSPMMVYPVSFPAAGTYYLWVRGWGDTNVKGEGKNDSLHIGLNGSLKTSADKIDQFPAGGWHWTNNTRDPAPATLTIPSAGIHLLNLWMREDGLALDRLEMTTDPLYAPGE